MWEGGGFQNNPKNFFVFSLFQAGGIGALAKRYSPASRKAGRRTVLPRSDSGFCNTLRFGAPYLASTSGSSLMQHKV